MTTNDEMIIVAQDEFDFELDLFMICLWTFDYFRFRADFFWELGINLTVFISIIYIYNKNKKTSILFFRNSPLGRPLLFCSLRPPLALVGDGHPNSHVTDANAG